MSPAHSPIARSLKWLAFAAAAVVVGATLYEYLAQEGEGGDLHYRLGNQRLEDGLPGEALWEFQALLAGQPRHAAGRLGLALALMRLGRNEEALLALDEAVTLRPDFAAAFANRGVLLDRLGRPERALADYRHALALDPELAQGPGWLARLLRGEPGKPPTIADRARYLEEELNKPPGERLLRLPERDAAQRPFKREGPLAPPRR